MREKLVSDLVKSILGPMGGSEELLSIPPWVKYSTGIIRNSGKKEREAESLEDGEDISMAEVSSDEQDSSDSPVGAPFLSPLSLNPKNHPPSLGLTFFCKKSSKPVFRFCVSGARYEESESGTKWKRIPFFFIGEKNVEENGEFFLDQNGQQVPKFQAVLKVSFLVFEDPMDSRKISVGIFLVHVGDDKRSSSIFQPAIRILFVDQGVRLLPTNDLQDPEEGLAGEVNQLAFQYRDHKVFGRGHFCSAVWKEIDWQQQGQPYQQIPFFWEDGFFFMKQDPRVKDFLNCDLRTEYIPMYPIFSPDFSWKGSKEVHFDSEELSEMGDPGLISEYLDPLVDSYSDWIAELESREPVMGFQEVFQSVIMDNKESLSRIRRSIQFLKENEKARLAFCISMKAMNIQARWKKGKHFSSEREEAPFLEWRPFQLAFILQELESILDPKSKNRDVCDLLWIPTGGGKTEAYLAIAAFAIIFRRLRDTSPGKGKTDGGVTVISRYTLRLLTIQQFRRALQMISACEFLRVFSTAKGFGWHPSGFSPRKKFLLGKSRIDAGLWVGRGVSPNTLKEALEILKGAEKDRRGPWEEDTANPAQILTCPACGNLLSLPDFQDDQDSGPSEQVVRFAITYNRTEEPPFDDEYFCKGRISAENARFLPVSPQSWILEITLKADEPLSGHLVQEWWQSVAKKSGMSLQSLSASSPGYFQGEKGNSVEICCTNPECDLRQQWDSEPFGAQSLPAFFQSNGASWLIPIPAITVDESIYSRCPSLVVSTVDKFARLPFKKETSHLFGNINHCTPSKGYHWNETLKGEPKIPEGFFPPELILQDELHLLDGPLGSMVGLYEFALDFLCRERNPWGIKYIASSATVKNSEVQVQSLFDRRTKVFPAPGFRAGENFFAHPTQGNVQDDDKKGRLYTGICCPGKGPLGPLSDLWSTLQIAFLRFGEERGDRYSTVTAYFNALRELAAASTLYGQDIPEQRNSRLEKEGMTGGEKDEVSFREYIELSGRRSSRDLPYDLEKLNTPYPERISALFATSMFGTGVDIPRLDLMIVNGQPKTTSAYIQATGRVGRKLGGLVIDYLRPTRPRDLNHYEFFCGYHDQLFRFVEPVGVMPFSPGALEIGAGPVLVAIIRNMRKTKERGKEDPSFLLQEQALLQDICHSFVQRAQNQPEMLRPNIQDLESFFDTLQTDWLQKMRQAQESEIPIQYAPNPWKGKKNGESAQLFILGSVFDRENTQAVFENTPLSLRNVEGSIALEFRR